MPIAFVLNSKVIDTKKAGYSEQLPAFFDCVFNYAVFAINGSMVVALL